MEKDELLATRRPDLIAEKEEAEKDLLPPGNRHVRRRRKARARLETGREKQARQKQSGRKSKRKKRGK